MNESECHHLLVELRKREKGNKALVVGNQCLTCGSWLREVSKSSIPDVASLPNYDESLRACWFKQRALEAQKMFKADRDDWFDKHNAYLNSPEWKAKRIKILQHAKWECEARLESVCTGRATEVHHTTYMHWRVEPLWELKAVCTQCHKTITGLDRNSHGDIAV